MKITGVIVEVIVGTMNMERRVISHCCKLLRLRIYLWSYRSSSVVTISWGGGRSNWVQESGPSLAFARTEVLSSGDEK